MKSSKTLIFDFDGTIANTLAIIMEIYNELALKYGAKLISKDDIVKIRGLGIEELMQTYNVNPVKLPLLLFKVNQRLHQKIGQIQVVDGLIPVLKKLKTSNFDLGILTSNSQDNVKLFLKEKEISDLFDFIYTEKELFGKDKVIKRLLRTKQLISSQVIYIGDEVRDIKAAKKAGISIISVSWGRNNNHILSKLNPGRVVDSPSQLLNLIEEF